MENLNASDSGMASAASPALVEDREVDKLPEIKAAIGGRFEIIESLCKSKNYSVFLARDGDSENGDLIRLKVLSGNAALDSSKIELFYLEASAASRLSHPNIARASEPEYIGNIHFCASEHYPNVASLRSLLDRRGWLAPELAASIAGQIAEALEYAHSREVLHLNLRPENILIGTDGRVIVTDFGIGANDECAWARTARSRQLPAQYASPEQAQGLHIDYTSDLYSLGILLFEMLTDRVPFDSLDPEVVKRKQMAHAPLAPQVFRSGVSALQSALVMSLLEKSPDKRCHNTTQLRSVLRSLASDSSIARNNLAALEIRKPDVAVSGPLEDNQRLQNETSDSKSAKEVEPASLEIIPTELPAELTGLSRDPFYEDPYALPARPEESESKSVNKSFSSGSAESRSGKSIESVASETTLPQHKPNRVAKRELFEPPTITVMDPPLNASGNVNANRSLPQVSSHKVDVQAGLTQEQAGGSKLRLGVLVLLSVATAILLSILLVRGNHTSRFLSEAPAAESGEAPSGLSLKPGTSTPAPAQGEAEKKDSAALEDINLAGSNDDKQTVSQQSPSRNQRWRAQPVVRSQNARAKRLLSRSQAGRLNQRSRQRIRSARWRYLRQLRQR